MRTCLGFRPKAIGPLTRRPMRTSPLGPAQYALGAYQPVPAQGARFNFEVSDVDAWWQRLSADADVVEPLFDTAYGTRKFTIRDPDGNELGFVQA
jgi:predicted enzyme related to lactoylglutathione lyase